MGKIFYIMGKSASGKDTIYKKIREELTELKSVVPYTTRPIREGERSGEEYYFTTEEQLQKMRAEGKVIEMRTYQTMAGPWSYATVQDGQIDLQNGDYLLIGTLESYVNTRSYFGADALVPLYIEVEDGERLSRALSRERQQKVPKYEELCRRFLADAKDFSEDRLRDAGIEKRFENKDFSACVSAVLEEIRLFALK